MSYSNYSVWYGIPLQYKSGLTYLDFSIMTTFDSDPTDTAITLDQKYHHRPDLLSYDLYGTPEMSLIFALLNPDIIKDPIYDFISGTTIMVPTSQRIRTWSK